MLRSELLLARPSVEAGRENIHLVKVTGGTKARSSRERARSHVQSALSLSDPVPRRRANRQHLYAAPLDLDYKDR